MTAATEQRQTDVRALNIEAWAEHLNGCERRAQEYAERASHFPAAHKDHHYYRRMAKDQLSKAAFARRQLELSEE